MDDELIKIDDLVRQRLSGAEDRERAGAWSNMRELLEREMPQATRSSGGGRAFRYMGLLLLLSSVAVGGYTLIQRSSGGDGASKLSPASRHADAVLPAIELPATGGAPAPAADGGGADPAPSRIALKDNNPVSGSVAHTGSHRQQRGPAFIPLHNAAASSTGSSAAPTVSTSTPRASTPPKDAVNTPAASARHTSVDRTAGTATRGIRSRRSSGAAANTILPLAASGTARAVRIGEPEAKPQPVQLQLVRDTIHQLRIVKHIRINPATRTPAVYSDTQALQTLVLEKWVISELAKPAPLTLSTEGLSRRAARRLTRQWSARIKSANASQDVATVVTGTPASLPPAIVIADAAAVKLHTDARLVPLSASRIDSRRSADAWSASEHFQNMVQNAKQQLAQTKYYMGLLGGINSTVAGPGSLSGFHFGITALMAMNERFALGAEFKFFQRINFSSTLRDDYYTTERFVDGNLLKNGQQYNIYRLDRDSNTHTFKFSNIASLELPLSAHYTLERFSILAGVNFGYHFRVDAEEGPEGGGKIGTINRYDTVLASAPAPVALNRPAEVSYNDFSSRFSIGYLVGATYQLSPAVHLDLRLTQQLWDNHRSTPGARTVSNTYYQLPSLQMSVGYRFQQQAKQPR